VSDEQTQQPQINIPAPSPLPVVFDVNALRLAGSPSQPAVRVDIYTPSGIHVVFLAAGQAVQLAGILIDEAKKARAIPDLVIANQMPRPSQNGHEHA
jgi:hypothetical protein